LERVITLREEAKKHGEPILRDKSFELLLETIKRENSQKILEIGVNLGLSSIAMLLTNKKASLTGIEIIEERVKASRENFAKFGLSDRAKVFQGDASEIIPVLTGEYDFIFLDGPKGHYFEYLPHLLSVLKVGGIIFADNVLFRGYVGDKVKTPHRFNTTKHSMENYLTAVTNSNDLQTEIIDIEDGISITKKIK
jgi:predicted O-methyltransferase YrrM